MSGSLDFLSRLWTILQDRARTVVAVALERRDVLPRHLNAQLRLAEFRLRSELDLDAYAWRDSDVGGSTDATHVLGFGSEISREGALILDKGLPLAVRHFIDGGAKTKHMDYLAVAPAELVGSDVRRVVRCRGRVVARGLLPCSNPTSDVYCPSYYTVSTWAVRKLTLQELFRTFRLPVGMDGPLLAGLSGYRQGSALPFEQLPTPDFLLAVFRRLWGDSGGGGFTKVELEDVHSRDSSPLVEPPTAEEDFPPHEDFPLVGEQDSVSTGAASAGMTAEETNNAPPPDNDVDTAPCSSDSGSEYDIDISWDDEDQESEDWNLEFELDSDLDSDLWSRYDAGVDEDSAIPSLISDDDSTVSLASDVTLAAAVEPHEVDPARLIANPGPPFSVGDHITCDWANLPLAGAEVTMADHPRYTLEMEDGTPLSTTMDKAHLIPTWRWEEDPRSSTSNRAATELESEVKRGSFGVRICAQVESLRRIREEKEYAKAVKADDAEVPVALWSQRISAPGVDPERKERALGALRRLGFRWFMRSLRRDCFDFLRFTHGDDWFKGARSTELGAESALGRDVRIVRTILWHATHTNWFEYGAGSRLAFFRFPLKYSRIARDGVPINFETEGPTSMAAQPHISDPATRSRVKDKLRKVLRRKYVLRTCRKIKSLIKYFAVPKGEDDIRMVYDATANGLNDAVWVPTFWMPTVWSLIRTLDTDSWMTDRDIADMFLNFQLHPTIIPYAGVDLGPLHEDEGDQGIPRWAVWDRMLMGFSGSPYGAVKLGLVVEEVCRGNRHITGEKGGRELNPFQWREIRLNLPGSDGYDPRMSWVSKLRADGMVACDLATFMDDERVSGPTAELTWQASHVLASRQSYLGVQDAARKVRPCSQTPGAWAGSVVHVVPELGVCALLSQANWDKSGLAALRPNLLGRQVMSWPLARVTWGCRTRPARSGLAVKPRVPGPVVWSTWCLSWGFVPFYLRLIGTR